MYTWFTNSRKFFSEIIIAGRGDIPAKPHPAPFKLCLQSLKVDSSQAIYVGDDWHIDICGAENAGLKAIWLQHKSVKRSWHDVKNDTPIIITLEELLDMDNISF